MELKLCKVKTVKADIANKEIKFSFSVAYNDDNMKTAEALGVYVGQDAGMVEVHIIPQQPPLASVGA